MGLLLALMIGFAMLMPANAGKAASSNNMLAARIEPLELSVLITSEIQLVATVSYDNVVRELSANGCRNDYGHFHRA